jgi:hypothetical protein
MNGRLTALVAFAVAGCGSQVAGDWHRFGGQVPRIGNLPTTTVIQ